MPSYSVVDNNILDRQGILNILRTFVFGDMEISLYDQDKVYNMGDKCYIIDVATGNLKVLTAAENGITGKFNSFKWNEMTLSDTINRGLDDVVVISRTRPSNPLVQVWVTEMEYSVHYIPIPDQEEKSAYTNILFIDNAIPMVEDTDTSDLSYLDIGDIVFDIEGKGVVDDDEFLNIDLSNSLIVDEQDDITIDDDIPSTTDPAFLWVDTDLTDDDL